ncbi:MAG: hypothetical protein QOE91_1712 [Gaiellaceae bacterium]|jgi:hypothetical protein|nr:hypothetical protein [Gaiellaceae bacterium]
MTPGRVLSLLCLVVCASALVGCAGGDALALDPVAQAASTTAKTTSSRFEFRASVAAGSVGSFSFNGNGVFDGKNKSGWMNMHFALPPAFQLQLGSTDPSMEMVFDGSHGLVMYMRSPLFDKIVPTGKWVKMDLEKMAKKEGVDLGALMNVNQADPSQSLRMLMASSDARVTGSERIRGVQTTHYAFNIDFAKLAHDNKAFEQLKEATGSVSAPAEAWIDTQGRVRRLVVTMSLGGKLATPMTMTMTEDLYDFGVRTHVTPPSEDLVVDLSALSGS